MSTACFSLTYRTNVNNGCSRFVAGPLRSYAKSHFLCVLGPEVDPVIKAIVRLEFEDGLRMGVLPGECLGPKSSRTYGVVVMGTLLSDRIPILLSSTHRWC